MIPCISFKIYSHSILCPTRSVSQTLRREKRRRRKGGNMCCVSLRGSSWTPPSARAPQYQFPISLPTTCVCVLPFSSALCFPKSFPPPARERQTQTHKHTETHTHIRLLHWGTYLSSPRPVCSSSSSLQQPFSNHQKQSFC